MYVVGAEKAIEIEEEPGGENNAIGIKKKPGEADEKPTAHEEPGAVTAEEELKPIKIGGATNKETATAKETTDEAEEELGAELGAAKAIAIEDEPGGENNAIGIKKKPGEAEEKPTAHEEPGAATSEAELKLKESVGK